MAKSVLGRRMNALIPENETPVAAAKENVSRETLKIRLSQIEPNREQPRKQFDEEKLRELADSITQYGLIEPVIVRKTGKNYQLIAGERRWRAAKLAGLREIPVIVREMEDREASEISLIENLQREDLNPVEEAFAYRTLIEKYGMKQEEVAGKVSKNRATVANSLRLLQLPEDLLALLEEGRLTPGHARAILSLDSDDKKRALAEKILSGELSVREAERLAKTGLSQKKPAKKKEDSFVSAAGKQLTERLGTKVKICPGRKEAGKIVIDYYSTEGLNVLIEKLMRGGRE